MKYKAFEKLIPIFRSIYKFIKQHVTLVEGNSKSKFSALAFFFVIGLSGIVKHYRIGLSLSFVVFRDDTVH